MAPEITQSAVLNSLHPVASQNEERGNCNSMQNVSGLEVDTVGRLWALDRGSAECPARLWIFDLSDDSLVLEYEFPVGYSVTRNYRRRSLTSLVLDETPDAWFAYIADDAYLIVFTVQFENNDSWAVRWNDSWSVSMNGGYVFSLGLQPKENRRWLYLGDSYSDSLFALPVDELRREELDLTATEVGDKTAPTFRMLMDNQGKLFFDSRGQNQIAVWDSNEMELDDYEIYFESPELFQERYLQEDYWHKFSFAIDNGNFWLLEKSNVQVQNEKDGKRKWKNFYQLHKAVTGTKSYLY